MAPTIKELQNRAGFPEDYPSEIFESIQLEDGTPVVLRPILPSDAPLLQAGFARLSPETIYLRFLESFKELPDAQAKAFATVDYHQRMALVASIQENGEERLIGVARYGILGDAEPGSAESGIVVDDEFQNRGLGSILMDRLIRYARAHGVNYFLATVHFSNAPILHFIQGSGLPFERKMLEPGVWEIRIDLWGKADDGGRSTED